MGTNSLASTFGIGKSLGRRWRRSGTESPALSQIEIEKQLDADRRIDVAKKLEPHVGRLVFTSIPNYYDYWTSKDQRVLGIQMGSVILRQGRMLQGEGTLVVRSANIDANRGVIGKDFISGFSDSLKMLDLPCGKEVVLGESIDLGENTVPHRGLSIVHGIVAALGENQNSSHLIVMDGSDLGQVKSLCNVIPDNSTAFAGTLQGYRVSSIDDGHVNLGEFSNGKQKHEWLLS